MGRRAWLGTFLLVVLGLAFSGVALAGKRAPKSKPPKDYPAGVPYLAGGKLDPKLSVKGSVILRYKGTVDKIAAKMLSKLKAGKWKIEPDKIPGMKGKRFLSRKGAQAIYFTIRPDYGSPDVVMMVTDTNVR